MGNLNYVLGKNNTKLAFSMDYDDKTFSNNKDIAEEFNNYFSNIAIKLASDKGPAAVPFEPFLPKAEPFSFSIN